MRDYEVVKRIIELCDGLDVDDPDQRDIKKYLTQFLLIKICGVYENKIDSILYERMRKSCDSDTASLISSAIYAYKNLKLDALKGNIVGKFSEEHKKEFTRRVEGSKDAYNAIVNARNAIAHGSNANMTYEEFKKNSNVASDVLVELAAVLNMDQSEIGSE